MTPEQWTQVVAAIIGTAAAIGAYFKSRQAATTAEEAGVNAKEAKHAAENGVAERTALRERAERAEQELTAMSLQRDAYQNIVKFMRGRPDTQAALREYTERRQLVSRDVALDALLAPNPPASPPPASPPTWLPWAAGAGIALAALGGAIALGRKFTR